MEMIRNQLDWDEINTTRHLANTLVEALTGHPDKSLWWIAWVETFVRQYEAEHEWSADCDPDATTEMMDTVRAGIGEIKAALTATEER